MGSGGGLKKREGGDDAEKPIRVIKIDTERVNLGAVGVNSAGKGMEFIGSTMLRSGRLSKGKAIALIRFSATSKVQ
eukprot:6599452-Pyramimonas_sp.AAC.4